MVVIYVTMRLVKKKTEKGKENRQVFCSVRIVEFALQMTCVLQHLKYV